MKYLWRSVAGSIALLLFVSIALPPALTNSASGWKQTAGPTGGVVNRLAMIHGQLWASMYSGGIYELRVNGWTQIGIDRGLPENRIYEFVAHPTDGQTVYASQTIACAAKSSNIGASWSGLCPAMLSAADSPNFSSKTLALDPDDPQTIYVPGNTHDGTPMLLVSSDGGTTWTKRGRLPTNYSLPFTPQHLLFFNSKMYLSTELTGVFVSTDKGQTWAALGSGLQYTPNGRLFIFRDQLYLQHGAVMKFNVRQVGFLFRLNAAGTAWEMVTNNIEVSGLGSDGTTLWVSGQRGELRQTKDGTTFTKLRARGLPTTELSDIASSGGALYVGTMGYGVYKSTDGGQTFRPENRNLRAIATREVHINPKKPDQLYVTTWDRPGMYVSRNGGQSFSLVGEDYPILTVAVDPKSFAHLYAGGLGANLYEGLFNGRQVQWTLRRKPGPPAAAVKALAVHPKKSNLVLAGLSTETKEWPKGYGLWYTTNHGRNWKQAKGIPNLAVHSILFHPQKPKIVYAAALTGGVYKSTNQGRSFSQIGGRALKYTYRLTIDPRRPDHLLAGSNLFFAGLSTADQISGLYGGIFETTNGGKTWTEITRGIRQYDGTSDPAGFRPWLYNFGHLPNYEQLVIDAKKSNRVFVGHHGESVVMSDDGGMTWDKQEQGMIPGDMHNYAYCLGQTASGRKLYACTCGRGLFAGAVARRSGQVAWEQTRLSIPAAMAKEFHEPRSAAESKALILSGQADHAH